MKAVCQVRGILQRYSKLSHLSFSPYFKKECPFPVNYLEDVTEEERNIITYTLSTERFIYKYGILGQSTLQGNSNCVLTHYHIFQYELPLHFSKFKVLLEVSP